jgi:hypothetical protein
VPAEKPLLAMTVSTGWAVRNFFQTGVVEWLQREFRVVVVATPAIHAKLVEQGYADEVQCVVREDRPEPRSWRYLRQIRKKLYMAGRDSATDAIWERYVRRPLYQRVGGYALSAIVRWFDARRLLRLAESADFRLNRDADSAAFLRQHAPDMLFATHASTFFEESLLHESVRAGIPVVFMVLSWDHLSSKVVLCGRYRHVLVWNDVTRDEILATSDAYAPDDISIVGVPQFDCYAEPARQSYADWCGLYGLDPRRRTILFSTMPQVRHDQQHVVIGRLLDEIRVDGLLPADTQVLIKCHPFDNTDRYDSLLQGGRPVGIARSTLAVGQRQEDWFPSAEEMLVSRDALFHCAVNVNIFSTVTLEAAFLDKPIVHVAFDPYPVANRIPCREYYNFDHFRNITRSGASILAESFAELFAAVRLSLDDPTHNASNRQALVQAYFHGVPGEAARTVAARVKCVFDAARSRQVGSQ